MVVEQHRMRRVGAADYALLTGLGMVFGSSFLFTNVAVQSIPPFTVVASRITLAALVILVTLRIKSEPLPSGSVWRWIFASALFGNAIPFSLISWGQQQVDAGLTAIFMAVMPLTTVVLAHFVTSDEKLNRWTFCGVWFGLIGVVVLMGWPPNCDKAAHPINTTTPIKPNQTPQNVQRFNFSSEVTK